MGHQNTIPERVTPFRSRETNITTLSTKYTVSQKLPYRGSEPTFMDCREPHFPTGGLHIEGICHTKS